MGPPASPPWRWAPGKTMVMQNPAFGLELGAGIRWRSPERGISGELKGHTHPWGRGLAGVGPGLLLPWGALPLQLRALPQAYHGHPPSAGMDAMHPIPTPTVGSSLRQNWPMASPPTTTACPLPRHGVGPLPHQQERQPPLVLGALCPTNHAGPWQLSLAAERQETNTATSPVDHSLKLRFSNLV